jgi:hypothetical protein
MSINTRKKIEERIVGPVLFYINFNLPVTHLNQQPL